MASLIVAASDLNVVRLIRRAMRAADIASGRGQPVSGLGPAPDCYRACWRNRRHYEPTPVYEPRQHIHPAPVYEPRTVNYSVRYVAQPEPVVVPPPIQIVVETEPAAVRTPFPPVWKTLPPVEVEAPARRPIKIERHHPDNRHRGMVIDVHA